jgi:hypothetical protein
MTDKQLLDFLINPPAPDEEKFRGSFERFLLPSIISLKGIVAQQGSAIFNTYKAFFQDLPAVPAPAMSTDAKVNQRRKDAITAILGFYGFSHEFQDNVLESKFWENNTVMAALGVVMSNRFFKDDYTGTGCQDRLKKLTAVGKALEMPDEKPAP